MKLRFPLFMAIGLILFSSCSKDISEEDGIVPDSITASGSGTGGAGGTGGSGGSSVSGCKDCLYYPECSGSVYTFSDTSFTGSGSSTTYTYQFVKDTMLEGKNYQKMSVNGQISYLNCTSGVSSTISINGVSSGGTTIPYAKFTMVKANEAVGASWADVITVSGQAIVYTSTIVSKGTPRTVAGHVYPDVIHVHEQTTEDAPGIGTINAGQTDYYYARGTGLIESISIDDFSGMQILHHVLLSATIP